MSEAAAGTVAQRERIAGLDAQRGIALFAVLLVNVVAFAGPHLLASQAQLSPLPGASFETAACFAVQWLAIDKANQVRGRTRSGRDRRPSFRARSSPGHSRC